MGVSQALSRARPPKSNLDKGMHKATRDLREDTSIVILPADKGNATVVMNRTEYMSKMNQMLEDTAYTKLKKDPTIKIETRVRKELRSLEDGGYISSKERKYLTPQCSNPPQIYGLPKIHKDNTHCISYWVTNLSPGQDACGNPHPPCWVNQLVCEELPRVCATSPEHRPATG